MPATPHDLPPSIYYSPESSCLDGFMANTTGEPPTARKIDIAGPVPCPVCDYAAYVAWVEKITAPPPPDES